MLLQKIKNFSDFKLVYQKNDDERLIFFNIPSYYHYSNKVKSDWENIFIGLTKKTKNNEILVLNNMYWGDGINDYFLKIINNSDNIKLFNYYINIRSFTRFTYDIYVAPSNLLELVNNTISNNKKLLKPIIESIFGSDSNILNFSVNIHSTFLFAICLFDDKPNLLAWLLRLLMNGTIRERFVTNLYLWLKSNSKSVSKLSKKTLTAYKSEADIQLLLNEMEEIKNSNLISEVINSFNTAQRQMLKNCEISNVDSFILRKFSFLSDEKKLNFIKKVSNINDINEFFKLLRAVVADFFIWNRDSFIEYLNENKFNVNIIYDKNNIVILEVFDYHAINNIGKTTNWCITKQKKFWNDYITQYNGKRKQFVIFNFNYKEDSDLSIIGISTTRSGAIEYAHSFVNINLMEDVNYGHKLDNIFNIYDYDILSILRLFNINKKIFADSKIYPFDWNVKSALSYYNENDLSIYYTVLYEDDNHLVIKVNTSGLINFIGNKLELLNKIIRNGDNSNDFILFFDFTKEENDEHALHIITTNVEKDNIPYIEKIFNYFGEYNKITISELCSQFNINEDLIIYRPNRIDLRFKAALYEEDYDVISKMLNKYGIKLITYNKGINQEFWGIIVNSVLYDANDSILSVIYDANIKLSQITTLDNVKDLISDLFDKAMIRKYDEEKILNYGIEYFQLNPSNKFSSIKSLMVRKLLLKIIKTENNPNLLIKAFEDAKSEDYSENFVYNTLIGVIQLISEQIKLSTPCKEALFTMIFENEYSNVLEFILNNYPDIIDDNIRNYALLTLDENNKFFDKIVISKSNEFNKPYRK